MESIKEIFKIGYGPSSSHTYGPAKAANIFKEKNKNANRFVVYLYGSLAKTGKGHLTDKTLKEILVNAEIIFDYDIQYQYHPNGMHFYAYLDQVLLDDWLVFSVGGGFLKEHNEDRKTIQKKVYPHSTMSEVLKYLKQNNIHLIDYIKTFEDDDLMDYLSNCFDAMEECIQIGLNATSNLPGSLNLPRRSKAMYQKYLKNLDKTSLTYALTLAVSEENANGGVVVTAPTCGASGVVPGVLFSEYYFELTPKEKLLEALAIAGFICLIIKTNASISGAEVGCCGEVGVASSASSGMLAYLYGGNEYYIEYASEIALEHHLGMTCDPIDGMVQIPCIERNALAALFSYNASKYALLTDGDHYVKLDSVIAVMHETGIDMNDKYKETSTGGLALRVKK